jgi:hypothetical protein
MKTGTKQLQLVGRLLVVPKSDEDGSGNVRAWTKSDQIRLNPGKKRILFITHFPPSRLS